MNKRYAQAAFWFYCLIMLLLLFLLGRSGYDPSLPYREQLRCNLIPFRTITLYVRAMATARPELIRYAVVNLGGNVIMFIPLGLGISGLWPEARTLWNVVLITAVVIALVELAQLFTLVGTCDIDDLILNIFGSLIGYWLYRKLFDAKQTA